MFRHSLGYLIQWLHRKDRKPLLLRGARQVGKTWLARELARAEGVALMEVNFELRPEFKRAFDNLDPKAILQSLGFMGLNPPHGARALWLFDEIQECPQAVTALRYFFEQMPELPIAATGSLLEFALSQAQLSMPVGRVESLWLGPMTFHEFLYAEGRADLAEHLTNASPFASESVLAAEEAAKWLPSYFFCGGMPEAVKTWTEDHDTEAVGRAHLGLLQTYRQDFHKYAPRIKPSLAEALFLKAPALVGSRFKYSHVDATARAAEVRPAVEALEKAGVIRLVRHTSASGLPLALDENPKITKLMFIDVGLMHTALRFSPAWIGHADLLAVHRGAVAEQFVAQELLASVHLGEEPSLYFWARDALNSQAEVDFVIASGPRVIPIEVKAGATGSLKSLRSFLSSHPSTPFGIRLFTAAAAKHDDIYSLPLCYAGSLQQHVPRWATERIQ